MVPPPRDEIEKEREGEREREGGGGVEVYHGPCAIHGKGTLSAQVLSLSVRNAPIPPELNQVSTNRKLQRAR